ncbi:MAG: hypothetical protein OXF06_01285 [Bacteroidetes bacterium]|nr:hypothetical protein [Bacteroidota bacterium]
MCKENDNPSSMFLKKNIEPVGVLLREATKWAVSRVADADAIHGRGSGRRSDEVPVMGMDQKG